MPDSDNLKSPSWGENSVTMPKPTVVPVNPAVVNWAVANSGWSVPELSASLGVGLDDVEGWMKGSIMPTRTQFSRLAHLLAKPTAIFFSPDVPQDTAPPVAFRSSAEGRRRRPTRDELITIRDIFRVQRLAAWTQADRHAGPVALPKVGNDIAPSAAATQVRAWLRIPDDLGGNWRDAREAYAFWRVALDGRGVSVVHVSLGRTGLRGFSLSEPYFPVIAINTGLNVESRTYSLLHELGHLVTNTGSSCAGFATPERDSRSLETWCDSFAAAIQMPAEEVRAYLLARFTVNWNEAASTIRGVKAIRGRFRVSARAAALRLIELGLAQRALYEEVLHAYKSPDFTPESKGGGGGTRVPELRLRSYGASMIRSILHAVDRERVTERDALEHLHVRGSQLEALREVVAH